MHLNIFLSSLSSELAECDKENGWFLSNIISALGELKWCLGRPAFSQDSFITRIDELRRGIRTLAMIITILLEGQSCEIGIAPNFG